MVSWRWVVGYRDFYEVSDDGRIRSMPRQGAWSEVHEVRPQMHSEGYHTVGLCSGGKVRNTRVHRVVAEAFLPDFADALEVDHINGDRTDNRLANLRMATPSQNCMNSRRKAGACGVVGVCWAADRQRYLARIKVGRKVIYLGKHRTLEAAAKARTDAELEHFGAFRQRSP